MVWFSTSQNTLLRHRMCIASLLCKPSVLLQVLIIIEWVGLDLPTRTHILVMYSTYLSTVMSHFVHRYLKITCFVLTDSISHSYIFITLQMEAKYSSFLISVLYSAWFLPFYWPLKASIPLEISNSTHWAIFQMPRFFHFA